MLSNRFCPWLTQEFAYLFFIYLHFYALINSFPILQFCKAPHSTFKGKCVLPAVADLLARGLCHSNIITVH